MAAFTSKALGNWSASGQTTWNEVGVPGNGDTVIIGHGITVDVDTIIGASPAAGAGTAAILVNATGSLTIAAGKRLTSRGDVKLDNTTLTLAAGAIFEFDASLASSPSTARYICKIGTNATDPLAQLIVNGTSGSRCTIRSVNTSSAANGRFVSNGNDNSGQIDATYVDLLRIGDASNPAFEWWLGGGRLFRLQNATLDACGALSPNNGGAYDTASQVILNRVSMKNTVGSSCGYTTTPSGAITGAGIRSMTFCVWDKSFNFYAATGWTIDDNMFQGNPDFTGNAAASFNRNMYLIPQADGGDWSTLGPITDMYVLRIGNPTNQHGVTTGAVPSLFKGLIFDAPDMTNGAGDCLTIATDPGSPVTLTFRQIIVLSRSGGGGVGTLVSNLVNSNVSYSIEHCTYDADQGIYFETAGFAGQCTSIKSNLAFSVTATTALIISGEPGTTTDVVASINVRNNGVQNPASTDGYSNNLTFSSGTPGAGDVNGNPAFVDSTRTLKTWDTSLGGAGTVANAIAELIKINDASGYNARYNCIDLLNYLREGMRPTNAAFRAAHDIEAPTRGWIGAVGDGAPVSGRNAMDLSTFPKPLLRVPMSTGR